eukprot:9648272-Alexandrium_andersonii.AAC.1
MKCARAISGALADWQVQPSRSLRDLGVDVAGGRVRATKVQRQRFQKAARRARKAARLRSKHRAKQALVRGVVGSAAEFGAE